jgi:hypothetical protein
MRLCDRQSPPAVWWCCGAGQHWGTLRNHPLVQALVGADIDARDIADPAFDLFRGGLTRLMPGLLVPSASDGADPTLAVAEGLFLLLARRAGRGVAMVVIEDSHLADAETHGPTVVSALAPTVEAFFTERLLTQRQASPRTVESYRDPLRPLLLYAGQKALYAGQKALYAGQKARYAGQKAANRLATSTSPTSTPTSSARS